MTGFILMSLVFSFLYCACKSDATGNLEIVWENNKAIKLLIPKKLVGKKDQDKVQVLLFGANNAGILGEFSSDENNIVFQPAIPFTHGMTYKVQVNGKPVASITIGTPSTVRTSKVLAIYPTKDTVPENLLKIYIEFSSPMQEGESLNHIVFIKNNRDTLQNTFLDLQPELWNNDHTILTVWFDPGRIKRDLQPNLIMGPPLIKGNHYTLIVKQDWKSQDGSELQRSFIKDFVTVERDSISPDLLEWNFKFPRAGTSLPLDINFNESLDYMVAKNAIHIVDNLKKELPGTVGIHPGEEGLSFVPASPWKKGEYFIIVESRLEDHAGNNLDRLFDNDLIQKQHNGLARNKLFKIE